MVKFGDRWREVQKRKLFRREKYRLMQVDFRRHDQIRNRAYEIYVRGGRKPGHELDDWLRAEDELAGAPPKPGGRRIDFIVGPDGQTVEV